MESGVELILSLLCLNSTCLNSTMENPITIYQDNEDNMSSLYSDIEMQFIKLKEELKGYTLTVTTLQDPPLSGYTMDDNGNIQGNGVAFDVFNYFAEKFNFTYNIVPPERNLIGSVTSFNGSLIEMLYTKKADIAVAFVPIFTGIREYVTLSSSTLDEGEWIMIMVRPSESATGTGLLAPFDAIVWLLIMVSLFAVGPIIYGLIFVRNKMLRGKYVETYTLPHCVWFVYGALMRQGSTLSPNADSTRILFATWWLFITILTSFYTANLTAFLTLSRFTLPINSYEDILRKEKPFVARYGGGVEYAIRYEGDASEYAPLNRLIEKKRGVFIENMNDNSILIDYVEKQNYVFVRDRPAIDHLIYNDYKYRKTLSMTDERIQCPFAISKTAFMKKRRTFAYRLDFNYSRIFDREILRLVESGIVKSMETSNLTKAEICPLNLGSNERQLRNGDLIMTYYIIFAGFCTAVVVFFTELFFKYLNAKKIGQQHLEQKNVQPIKHVTPPPPYTSLFKNQSNFKKFSNNMDHFPSHASPSDPMYGNGGMSKGVRQVINGRDYMVFKDAEGGTKLIPMRQPSAVLFQYNYTN